MTRYRQLLTLVMALITLVASAEGNSTGHPWLLVTNAAGNTISYIDPDQGVMSKLEVGKAPFGIVTDNRGHAYVATAEGVAVVDIGSRMRLSLIPYLADIGPPDFGEYRKGGMGIDVSADGRFIYVGVYLGEEANRLEVMDSVKQKVIASYAVGQRPFDVLLSGDERHVYSVDHDSYSVTQVNLWSKTTDRHEVAPLGYGSFDKPHYAVFDHGGRLLLPVQGQSLVRLDPVNRQTESYPLTADTHQHGIAISEDGTTLAIVGAGAVGGARKGPSMTLYELNTHHETVFPLERTHEAIVLSPDGRYAYLTGGQSFTGGWNGLSVVDLDTKESRYLVVPDQPLGIVAIPAQH